MKRLSWKLFLLGVLIFVGGALNSSMAAPDVGTTTRINLTIDNTEPNRKSQFPDMSANGRFITYASDATNLVVGDSNDASDIFVFDRETSETERVSILQDGTQTNGSSYSPAISDDGRYVTFHSFATNLVPNDFNNVADIFLFDRVTKETRLVSFVLGGFANDVSFEPEMSGDGRTITFFSYASNLVGGDLNGSADVFVYDRVALTMERVSVDTNEVEGNGNSTFPTISDNGQRIVFESAASNLVTGDGNGYTDIFMRDRPTGSTIRLSLSSTGIEGNGASSFPAISGNGGFVAFTSFADNLIDNDGNFYQDVFVRDVIGGQTERVSIASNGGLSNKSSYAPSISDDGRYIAFETAADSLVSGDNNGARDVFVYDRTLNVISLESISGSGVQGNLASREAVLSGNGRQLTFSSEASNLVPNDNNGVQDTFYRDRFDPESVDLNHNLGGPGSQFALTGVNFVPGSGVDVAVNGQGVTAVTISTDGSFTVRLDTLNNAQQGTYLVEVTQGELRLVESFRLQNGAPIRPSTGSGVTVSGTTPYVHTVYAPLIFK